MADNNSVVDTMMESVQDDAALAPEANALSEALEAAQSTEEPAAEGAENVQEPEGETSKALKGRMKSYESRGYKRGQREAEARWAEEKRNYEERLAKYAQRDMEDEVKGLVDKGMPEELAKDYVRLKHGQPQQEQPIQQNRDDAGRFTSQGNDANAAATQRAQILMEQAANFEAMTDGAVTREQILDAFQNNPQIKAAVSSGEMNFIDVGKRLAGNNNAQRAPRMVRTTNDGAIKPQTIAGMSDADFAKMNERIRQGAVFDSRR